MNILLIILTAFIKPVFTLDIRGSGESVCFPITSTYFDFNWASGQSFYLPMSSRLFLYQIVTEMSLPIPPKDIIEGEMYYDSCIHLQFEGNSSLLISGYGGTRASYLTLEPEGNGFIEKYENGSEGRTWITLTDNESFAVKVNCFKKEISWGVISTREGLPPEVKEEVVEHVVEVLGLSPEYFTELRYATCQKGRR